MFWKIALTVAVVLLLSGRTAALNNPLLRLLLPRGWSSRLIALAPRARNVGRPTDPTATAAAEPRRPLLDRRVRLALLGLGFHGPGELDRDPIPRRPRHAGRTARPTDRGPRHRS